MSGSRASQEHEQRPCVDMVDRSGHLYWMIRIPAFQHLRRMGATATSVSCVESVSGVGPSHTLRMGSTPSSGYGTQHLALEIVGEVLLSLSIAFLIWGSKR